MSRYLLSLVLVATLAACTSGQRPNTREGMINRVLAGAPGQANPTQVISTELAFARMAQDKGQWTAFREYAADGALIFGRNGAIEAKPWLRTLDDPAQAVAWEPHRVWMSCDGSLAVTQGGFADPGGEVGTFNTVWQRRKNGDYRYVFDFGFPTQTAPVEPELIATDIARCGAPAQPSQELPADARYSADRTLAWRFELVGEGTRNYEVWLAGDGGYRQVVDISIAPTAE